MPTMFPSRNAVDRGRGVDGWRRWLIGGLALLVGVAFIAVAFANSLFSVGPAFEEMIDDFRPILEQESLNQAKADIAALGAVDQEFSTQLLPGMAEALGMTPQEMGAFLGENFPAVANGAAALPQIVPTFDGLINTLEAEQGRFAAADGIPLKTLPATTVPWGIVLAGVAALAVGVAVLMGHRFSTLLVIVLGLALVIVPVLFSLPGKSADADQLNENLKPVYTTETVEGAERALMTVQAMGSAMTLEMLPALAQQLGQTPEELQAFLGSNFPATANALQILPDALLRFEVLSEVFAVNLDNYETLKPVKFVPIIWTIIIGGIVLVLAGGFALDAERRQKDLVVPEEMARPREKAGAGI